MFLGDDYAYNYNNANASIYNELNAIDYNGLVGSGMNHLDIIFGICIV